MFMCLHRGRRGGEGYHSQYLNMESFQGSPPTFPPEAKLSLIVSSQTGLLCIKTICKPASLVFGQNAPSHNLYFFTAKKIL